jgi:iron(III) transport system ATP-binding protein
LDAALAQFVGEAALLPGVVAAGFATCALGRLELARAAPDGLAEVMVRPEQIRFESRARPGVVQGQVLAVTYYGRDASVAIALDAGAEPVTARVAGHMAPEQGANIWLSVEGPVMAYPRTVPRLRVDNPARDAVARSRALPKRVFVPTVKGRLI